MVGISFLTRIPAFRKSETLAERVLEFKPGIARMRRLKLSFPDMISIKTGAAHFFPSIWTDSSRE